MLRNILKFVVIVTLFVVKIKKCDARNLDIIGDSFKKNVNSVKKSSAIDLIFLVDASSSVGEENFLSELRFVRKILSDLTVSPEHTKIALITFGSQDSVITHVNSISNAIDLDKCVLLNIFLPNIKYTGGGTYTIGAFQTARQIILNSSRNDSKQAVFLITDGFSNGGDPIPIAEELKENNVTIFTIGIKTGRSDELEKLASNSETCYLLHGFKEFEALARRALHADLQDGEYVPVPLEKCDNLCDSQRADCTCGTSSGQYTCKCRRGYYGDGIQCQSCPKGTWFRIEDEICIPCTDPNHESYKALSPDECKCKRGFRDNGNGRCEVVRCPELKPPENGYFVGIPNKSEYCQNVLHNACGVRCQVGYSLRGNSIRLCQENATWTGIEPQCIIKTCARPPIPQYGQVNTCINSDLDQKFDGNQLPDDMPVDTECTFSCEKGHAMTGSISRTCLPVAQWDGLRTTCKPIRCHRLGKVSFGAWEPEICGRERQHFGSKCSLICKRGFVPSGESLICKSASGRGLGKWQGNGTKCIDMEAPVLKYPTDKITIETDPGSAFGILQLDPPYVSDNSGQDITIWAEPSRNVDEDNWDLATVNKYEIGITIVTYHALDSSGNEATYNVTIEVLDKEPPVIENCDESPAPFLTTNTNNITIEWEEPLFFDNSLQAVKVKKSKDFGIFDVGITEVTYTATDSSNNTNRCSINITVIAEANCETPPSENAICHPTPEGNGNTCALTCQEGYGFALTDKAICLHDSPGIWDVPECTPMQSPEVWEVVKTEKDCENNETLVNLGSIVEEDGGIVILSNCLPVSNEILRYKREFATKRQTQRVEFRIRHPKRLLQVAEQLGLNMSMSDPIINCKNGSVPAIRYPGQKIRCVLCPKGTYYQANRCIPCSVDQYSTKPGSLNCEPCPEGRSTLGRKRAKNKRACKALCPSNTEKKGITCEGKPKRKLKCDRPNICKNGGVCMSVGNRTKCNCTEGWVGTKCKVKVKKSCLCQNGGICHENYTCLCPKGFLGEFCALESVDLSPDPAIPPEEIVFNPCEFVENLCENNSTCINDSSGGYICQCTSGFIGKRCNILPCDYKPCLGDSICVNLEEENTTKNSYKCECPKGKINPPNCTENLDFCSPNPCENNGTCQSNNSESYNCICHDSFYGNNCEIPKNSNYVLYFPRSGINDFVLLNGPNKNLTEISVCTWIKTNDRENYGTILSYANEDFDNAFTITDYSGLVLYVNGYHVVTDVRLNDGKWHHLCIIWNYFNGSYTVYVNSKLEAKGSGISEEMKITGNGKIVLGQEQDTIGGKFSLSESFIGRITNLNVWNTTLSPKEVKSIMQDCPSINSGSIIQWSNVRRAIKGSIQIENSTFCSECPQLHNIPNGNFKISTDKKFATYNCTSGYILYFDNIEYKDQSLLRKCTASSFWEGNEDPICVPVLCQYPGYVPYAKVTGKFYNTRYKDKLIYICIEGYEPKEPQVITCLEDGTWSGKKPLCRGGQCESFPKPENSNMSIISEHFYEEELENVRLFEVGTQIEMTCLNDTQLQGESIISCQENGTWDSEIPSCQSPGCLAFDMPHIPPNSYTINEISGVTFESGTVISFKCRNGYEQIGLNFTECLSNGKWSFLNLSCNPIECVEPPSYDNMFHKNGYNITKYYFGNMLKYECSEGYVFYGLNTVRCLANGKWTKVKGKCARISCNKPNVLPGEFIIGNSYLYKDSISVICPDNSNNIEYQMKCTSTGQWLQIGSCTNSSS